MLSLNVIGGGITAQAGPVAGVSGPLHCAQSARQAATPPQPAGPVAGHLLQRVTWFFMATVVGGVVPNTELGGTHGCGEP